MADERVAQVGRAQERLAPRARRAAAAAAARRVPFAAVVAAQRAARGRSTASSSWSADSKPSTSSACSPSPPVVSSPRRGRAAGSSTGTGRPARSPAPPRRPRRTTAKRTLAEARWVGLACTRIHASVITPSVPSEPSSMRSGDGPAPEPGRRRDSHTPAGVIAAHRLDEVVDVRVERREVAAGARGDPAAERRELEGLREVAQRQAVLGELLLEARAGRAGLDARGARDRVDLEHAVHAP